jgi:hypothetical protein
MIATVEGLMADASSTAADVEAAKTAIARKIVILPFCWMSEKWIFG